MVVWGAGEEGKKRRVMEGMRRGWKERAFESCKEGRRNCGNSRRRRFNEKLLRRQKKYKDEI